MKKLIALFIVLTFIFTFGIQTAKADTALLPAAWHLVGNNGDAQLYQGVSSSVLQGMTTLTLTYDLHGNTFLGGDASAIIFDQNGWKYISLSNYGTNGKNGQQTVSIPLSAFGLNLTQAVGTFHTRFWHTGAWTVDIYSAVVSGGSPTPTPTITPTPIVSPTPTNSPTPTLTVTPTPTITISPTPTPNPKSPAHTVVVIEENQKLQDVLKVDYFTTLAQEGAIMVNTKALTHPSQPNYFLLFSGSAQGTTDDICPPPGSPYSTNNLGNQLLTAGVSFIGYSENLPTSGARTACNAPNGWDNNHTPWNQFTNIPQASNQPFTSFPSDFNTLPKVSFISPTLAHDAHDGTIQQASDWLKTNIEPYRAWAMANNSLLVITFDEDDEIGDNTIYTVFVGPMVKPGIYNEALTHFNLLSTFEDLYGASHLTVAPGITDIFK